MHHADRLGFNFERIPAVDGTDPSVAAAAEACAQGPSGRKISAGAYACFQSHRKAWQDLVDGGDTHAVVAEDDLLLAEDFSTLLDSGWIPADADFVRLETFGTRVHLSREPKFAVAGRMVLRLRSRHVGTGCYVISAGIALRLLEETKEVSEPIDEYLFSDSSRLFSQLVTYQMTPAPAVQGDHAPRPPSEGWSKSSILDRFAQGHAPTDERPESLPARLLRRLSQDLRARMLGTQYVVVPFG